MRSSAIGGFVAGLFYAGIYFILALMSAGAGHGTGIFFAAAWPYGCGLLVFPAIGFLVGDLKPFGMKVALISVLAIHYALVVNYLLLDWVIDPAGIEKMWDYSPLNILLPGAFYVLGQAIIWGAFISSVVSKGSGAPEQRPAADAQERVLHEH